MMLADVCFSFSYFCSFYSHEKFTLQYSNGSLSRRGKQWKNGLNSVLKHLPELDCAIVGEPTLMQLAIAEKVY
jgi:acetylornithine deacetylase